MYCMYMHELHNLWALRVQWIATAVRAIWLYLSLLYISFISPNCDLREAAEREVISGLAGSYGSN